MRHMYEKQLIAPSANWWSKNVHESKLIERTKDICTPKRRWEPLHSKQHKAPIAKPSDIPGGGTINEAQRGCRSLQSEHIWFCGKLMTTFNRFFRAFWSSAIFDQYNKNNNSSWIKRDTTTEGNIRQLQRMKGAKEPFQRLVRNFGRKRRSSRKTKSESKYFASRKWIKSFILTLSYLDQQQLYASL